MTSQVVVQVKEILHYRETNQTPIERSSLDMKRVIDKAFLTGDYDGLDEAIAAIDVTTIEPTLAAVIVQKTYAYRNAFPSRDEFLQKLCDTIDLNDERNLRLFRGLDMPLWTAKK